MIIHSYKGPDYIATICEYNDRFEFEVLRWRHQRQLMYPEITIVCKTKEEAFAELEKYKAIPEKNLPPIEYKGDNTFAWRRKVGLPI